MDGTRALAVALLLCLATLGGVSTGAAQDQSASMSVVSNEGAPGYLSPSSDLDRTGQRTVAIDVAGAVGGNVGEVRSTYDRVMLQRAVENADTEAERRAVIRNATERLVGRIDELERRESSAVDGYRSGDVGETELLRTLSVVDRRARATEETVDWLVNRAANLGMETTEDRLARQQTRLRSLEGPVRNDVADAQAGGAETRVHAGIDGGGIVLATTRRIDGESRYVREAVDPSARTDEFEERTEAGLSAAEDRIQELYPWVTNNSTPTATPVGPDTARLWRFTYSHRYGNLETYLDAETNRVVIERQNVDPAVLATSSTNVTDPELRVELHTSRDGGPLGVTAYDAETGDPVDAAITVDGDPVGTTEGERLWTVTPRGGTTINTTYRGHTLSYDTTFE